MRAAATTTSSLVPTNARFICSQHAWIWFPCAVLLQLSYLSFMALVISTHNLLLPLLRSHHRVMGQLGRQGEERRAGSCINLIPLSEQLFAPSFFVRMFKVRHPRSLSTPPFAYIALQCELVSFITNDNTDNKDGLQTWNLRWTVQL